MATVLITGANRGLGLAFVKHYADLGDHVIAGARKVEPGDALHQLAEAYDGRVEVKRLDVDSGDSVAALKAEVGAAPIDILINNAAVIGGPNEGQRLGALQYEGWLPAFNTNVLGPARTIEAFLDNVKASQAKKIVNISSLAGSTERHNGENVIYRTTKAALNNLNKGVAVTIEGSGGVAVAIHPGRVRTDMGGPDHPLAPEDAARMIAEVIDRVGPADNGRFLSYEGEALPL